MPIFTPRMRRRFAVSLLLSFGSAGLPLGALADTTVLTKGEQRLDTRISAVQSIVANPVRGHKVAPGEVAETCDAM